LVIFSCVLSLAFAEVILRAIYDLPNPIAKYYTVEAAKLAKTIKIQQFEFETQHSYNEQGFRDKPISSEKVMGVDRILFVGDSFTEGKGVSEDSRFSNRLIEDLGIDYEGVNVGQLATNPDVYLDNIKRFGVALDPDLIVMGIFLGNDFQGARGLPAPDSRQVNLTLPMQTSYSIWDSISLKFLRTLFQQVRSGKSLLTLKLDVEDKNYWELYFNHEISKEYYAGKFNLSIEQMDMLTKGFNQDVLKQIYEGRLGPGILSEAINNQLGIKMTEPFYVNEDYEKLYAYVSESQKIATEHGIRFLVLIIPDITQVHSNEFEEVLKRDFLMQKLPPRLHYLEEFRARLNNDLVRDNISFSDVTEALRSTRKLTYYLYDNHMNKLGHETVSQLLLPKVREIFNSKTQ